MIKEDMQCKERSGMQREREHVPQLPESTQMKIERWEACLSVGGMRAQGRAGVFEGSMPAGWYPLSMQQDSLPENKQLTVKFHDARDHG